MPTAKEMKKLSQQVVLAIDWAAAEYKYLEEFKEELKNIERWQNISEELRELKKASKLLKYLCGAERRAYYFEEEVERELIQLIPELELLGIDLQIITGFRDIASQLEIEHNMLVKLTSWYDSSLIKVEERRKIEHPEKAVEVHQMFLQLLHQIQQQVDTAEKWIQGLEVGFKKAQQLLPQLSREPFIKSGLSIINHYVNWSTPLSRKNRLFLAQYPRELEELLKYNEGYGLFDRCFPILGRAGMLNKKSWPAVYQGLLTIGKTVRNCSVDLFYYGFPALEKGGMINIQAWPKVVDGIVRMTELAGYAPGFAFERDLPMLAKAKAINQKSWPIIVEGLGKIADYQNGLNVTTGNRFKDLRPLFARFGAKLFTQLIFPTFERQPRILSFICFLDYVGLTENIRTEADIEMLIIILDRCAFRAHEFFSYIIHRWKNKIPLARQKAEILRLIEHPPSDVDIFCTNDLTD
ncbi:hypothetical protein HYX13_04930, partial [Candidatus Woesearchaeota archaeon]|nr:hypothetical protein [Candidatus Woesearchaeota archaeon]